MFARLLDMIFNRKRSRKKHSLVCSTKLIQQEKELVMQETKTYLKELKEKYSQKQVA